MKTKDRDHLHCCSSGKPHDKHVTVTGSNEGPCLSLIINRYLSRATEDKVKEVLHARVHITLMRHSTESQ